VDVTVTTIGTSEPAAAEPGLGSLRDFLVREPELRGRAELAGDAPAPGTMGVLAEAVTVALGPQGAAVAFAAVLITWIRQRRGRMRFRVTRADGSSLELSADHVRELDSAAVRGQVAALTRFLEEGGSVTEGGSADGAGSANGNGDAPGR
jgi:hypothetical protein